MSDHIDGGCECCGNWPVIVSQKCHPEADTIAMVNKDSTLEIICAQCHEPILHCRTDLVKDHESIFRRNIH